MVFAVAHVRGGGEMGRLWYERGKLLQKKNTFTDFIAVARHLVDTGPRDRRTWCPRRQRRGLLVGAVANLAPELFAGILAQVPFVDPLTHDPGSVAAADGHRMGQMGPAPRGPGRLFLHEESYSPCERRGQGLPGDPGDDIAELTPGVASGEMGFAALRL